MSDQTEIEHEPAPSRRRRGCMVWLAGLFGVLLLLLFAGEVYESLSEASDASAYTPRAS